MAQPGQTLEAVEQMKARLQKQLAEQAILLRVSQRLASSFELGKIIPHVAAGALEAAAADFARIVLYSDDDGIQVFGEGTPPQNTSELDSQVLALPLQATPIIVPDFANNEKPPLAASFSTHISAAAFWPLQIENTVLGVLWLGYRQPYALSESQQNILSTLAGQAAVAIANAQSYQQAQDERRWLEAVLGSTADPVLVINDDRQISLLNQAAEEVLSVNAANALQHTITTTLKDYPALIQFFEDDYDLTEDEEWTGPNGRTYSPRLSRVQSDTGETDGYVLILRDITHFKLLNRNQAEFVRLVSHDLRSPLTYMRGFASMMDMVGSLNDRQVGFVEKIQSGINQMTALVDNIQDAGRWDPETGVYEMEREPTDLSAMVQDIVANYQEVAARQQVTLTTAIAPNIPIIHLDNLMMERALSNLVNNAIKYSPNGGEVCVGVKLENDAVLISVRDNGLGIAEEHLPMLFQRGNRIVTQDIKKHKIKGSGLGLFIVRVVAQRHGGNAWAESTLGHGSTFYFSIPLIDANLRGASR